MTSLEIGGYNRSIFFLAGSIPDVQLGWFIFKSDVFHFEVNGSYLSIFLSQEVSLSESPEECCFTNITVSNDDYLIFLFVLVHG